MEVERPVAATAQQTGWPTDRAVLSLSRKVLVDHYVRRDIEAMMEPMDEAMTWVGPLACQHARSAAEMRALVEPEYGNAVELVDEHWGIRSVGAARVVMATYGAIVPDSPAADVVFRQTATFVWGLSAEGPRIVHLHLSNAYDVPARIERACKPGEDPVGYAVASVAASPDGRRSSIRFDEPGGLSRFVPEDSVLCLDAADEGCTVVCDGGPFAERERLSAIEGKLPPCFVRTHRSCIVNARRVESLWRYRVRLDDGRIRPIAERRYLEVAKAIGVTDERGGGRR